MFKKPLSSAEPQFSLLDRYLRTRALSQQICLPLEPEDYIIQAMADVSPPKWHLAHTTWFFESFILAPYLSDYRLYHPEYPYLFNSYYETVGQFHPRSQRGNLARPSYRDVLAYRHYVDQHIQELMDQAANEHLAKIQELIEVGIHHEQQHGELLLMDIKYNFFSNPLLPTYLALESESPKQTSRVLGWLPLEAGIYEIGTSSKDGFSYDNEQGRHRIFVESVSIGDRLISNGEYLEFMADNAYQRVDLWLSEGWSYIQQNKITHPLYWIRDRDRWLEFTLHGVDDLDLGRAVTHISWFEADAFARWKGARLVSEGEWEALAQQYEITGRFLDFKQLQPQGSNKAKIHQIYGDAWEWTSSSYAPYPGFRPHSGALGEYNGKFMANQYVLRGGSCVTPLDHIRPSYRNFFPSSSRWMFSGIRLAK